jgi:AhpD family alkylhydroperoxidase
MTIRAESGQERKKEDAMTFDTRTVELMAVAASVSANCQSCVRFHIEKARAAGAAREEIMQAVDVGKMVRRGAAAELDSVVRDLLSEQAAGAGRPAAGCGCADASAAGDAR